MPNNLHGVRQNIINSTFRKAAKSMNMSFEDSLKNIRDLIEIELAEHEHGDVHGHSIDHDHEHDHSRG
ncbi:hypothetical protein HYT01_03250 [Candidatus Giovannonibacteria bacterium]|nr:hypothetical protein [Candidatus Giovannonibacteria bacterium]